MANKKNKKDCAEYTFTGSIGGDVLSLVFGVIIGFVVPFLLWLLTINYFLTALMY